MTSMANASDNKALKGPRAKTRDLVLVSLCTALTAVCSWISIPAAIPFTLQTFAVFLTVGLIGGKRGSLSVLIYILLGAFGVPVFANFTGGLGKLLGITGGYIIGLLVAALVMWLIERLIPYGTVMLIISMAAGLIVCYIFGSLWFMFIYARDTGSIGFVAVLAKCVFPYIPFDTIKIALAIILCKRLRRFVV